MSENNGNGMKFGFNSPNTEETKPNENLPKENNNIQDENKGYDDLNEEYVDERTVTIALITNYSFYRKANDKQLPKRKDYIGSSVNASRILSSNKEEMEEYMPNILGISPNNDAFVTRIKQYFNNIRIGVDELGKKLNCSFIYRHKADYLSFKKEEDKIESDYAKVNRSDINKLHEALTRRITSLNILESKKCKYGRPVNIEEYLMYRHCLLYPDIAKDLAFVNSDPNIRFYFKDDRKEAEKLKKHRLEVNRAKVNYVACLGDESLFDSVYIQYCAINSLPIIPSLAEDRIDKEVKLDRFSTEDPVRFNRIFNDKDIKLIANIEMLIARGELIRYENNQNITASDGTFIGANMKEAIAWFKSSDNAQTVNMYFNKLKNI